MRVPAASTRPTKSNANPHRKRMSHAKCLVNTCPRAISLRCAVTRRLGAHEDHAGEHVQPKSASASSPTVQVNIPLGRHTSELLRPQARERERRRERNKRSHAHTNTLSSQEATSEKRQEKTEKGWGSMCLKCGPWPLGARSPHHGGILRDAQPKLASALPIGIVRTETCLKRISLRRASKIAIGRCMLPFRRASTANQRIQHDRHLECHLECHEWRRTDRCHKAGVCLRLCCVISQAEPVSHPCHTRK